MKIHRNVCQGCGMFFVAQRADQRYCSTKCRMAVRECEYCGHRYKPVKSYQGYCCRECGLEGHRREGRRGRFIILERDGFRCIYCGKTSFGDDAGLHVDHIIPRKEGGPSTASNLVTACVRCNLEKGSRALKAPGDIQSEVQRRNKTFGLRGDVKIKLLA